MKKLTPRVGDRVLFTTYPNSPIKHSRTGTVVATTAIAAQVKFDGGNLGNPNAPWEINKLYLTVLDREPVEWPDGWRPNGEDYAYHAGLLIAVDKEALQELLRTGPDMLERWDELMEGRRDE